jgi:hypothetical protein
MEPKSLWLPDFPAGDGEEVSAAEEVGVVEVLGRVAAGDFGTVLTLIRRMSK